MYALTLEILYTVGIKQADRELSHRSFSIFYYAFFKLEDGRSLRSCLSPQMINFKYWEKFIGKENIELDGLTLKGDLIDADSYPVEVKK